MYVLVLYLILNGVPVEEAIRSSNGVDYDKFPTLAACEAQAKQDMAMFKPDAPIVLKCEKRG